jgi:hypothetical protein
MSHCFYRVVYKCTVVPSSPTRRACDVCDRLSERHLHLLLAPKILLSVPTEYSLHSSWVRSDTVLTRGLLLRARVPPRRSLVIVTGPSLWGWTGVPAFGPVESVSESELLHDWRFTTNQFVLTDQYSPYLTSPLTRGWLYRLQLLLILVSAIIPRSESRETHDHILLSQIRHSPNLEGQVPVFISSRNSVARL